MLQDVTSPLHLSIVRPTLDNGDEVLLLYCEDEGSGEQENGENGLCSLRDRHVNRISTVILHPRLVK